MRRLVTVIGIALVLGGCGSTPADGLRLDTGKRNPERMLRFYFGSYLGTDGGDVVANQTDLAHQLCVLEGVSAGDVDPSSARWAQRGQHRQ